MSPEMIKGLPYSFSTDMWSVGILLYDMLLGNPPFRNKHQPALHKKILTEKIKLPSYLDASTHSVLKGLIERDVNKRLTLPKLKAHPFFKGIDWVKLANHDLQPPFRPMAGRTIEDTHNFDTEYTSAKPEFSPVAHHDNNFDHYFKNFSYVRASCALDWGRCAVSDVN
jgi:p70 ribosomal S6 kinase